MPVRRHTRPRPDARVPAGAEAEGRGEALARCLRQGIEAHRGGRFAEAEDAYRRALDLAPSHPDATHLLGLLAYHAGESARAADLMSSAIRMLPTNPAYHSNLGNVLGSLGRWSEAVASYRTALTLADDPEILANLGVALSRLGRHDEAVEVLERAVERAPEFAGGHYNLGTVLWRAGRREEAAAAFRRAVRLEPRNAAAQYNLGGVLMELGDLRDALVAYREAARRAPDDAEVHNNLGSGLQRLGLVDEAVECFARAVQLDPGFAPAHSNLLLCAQYEPAVSPEALLRAHREWNERHARHLAGPARHDHRSADPERPLRVGLVSPDLGRHPVGYFVVGLLEHHDRTRLRFVAYSDREPDDLTLRIRAATAVWRDTRDCSDEELADLVRLDGIDILVDLAGHTGRNRLLAFARRPAPVQITWAGYVGTTGLDAMDYLLSDRHYTPPGSEGHYAEGILRMPGAYVCYTPPDYAPDVTPPPCAATGGIRFGSFNHPAKLNARVLDAWGRILAAVPESHLVLRYAGLTSEPLQSRILGALAARGVDAHRIHLAEALPHRDLLAAYGDVDIALDPFPYSGGLTTCEALWMGVPVVTLTGRTFAGRHATSYLREVGLDGYVTATVDAYIERAVAAAADRHALVELRATLRERMARSTVCDADGFARAFHEVVRGAWRRWCATAGP